MLTEEYGLSLRCPFAVDRCTEHTQFVSRLRDRSTPSLLVSDQPSVDSFADLPTSSLQDDADQNFPSFKYRDTLSDLILASSAE